MATNIGIWPGSGSLISGSTPFGIYDNDSTFQADGPKVADWITMRLGYPIQTVEIKDSQIYACFEEAISEYSSFVNNASISNWLLNYLGQPTGSQNYTGKFPVNTFGFSKRYAQSVATEAGVGGEFDWKTGSINLTVGQQRYDLQSLWGATSESNSRLEIKEIWHYARAGLRNAGLATGQSLIDAEFGADFGEIPAIPAYYMLPIYYDVLRGQALELTDQIRKSNYSYEVINNKLWITPTPTATGPTKLYFRYTVNTDPVNTDNTSADNPVVGVADQANIPYQFMSYQNINSMGKQWIRKYTLALSTELLGHIRNKFQSIPIPEGEVTLDGDALIGKGREEKQALIDELKEFLDKTSNEALMQSEQATQENLQSQLNKIPLLPVVA